MTRQARKNTNLVENLKEINWWFDTLKRTYSHSRFDPKIIRYWRFSIELSPLQRAKWFQFNARTTDGTNNSGMIFLKVKDI